MINKHYREEAIKTYGEACEICGYPSATEVHHIDYQEQWAMEAKLRALDGKANFLDIMRVAKEKGYLEYRNRQLSKNDNTLNLACLCGNCHTLMHKLDVGMKLLKVLKERR